LIRKKRFAGTIKDNRMLLNEDVAGLFSVLQSIGGQEVQGEIQKFPNFEHLEASDLNRPQLAKLRELFLATGARFDSPPV
jgi:hypothetical protein